MSTAHSVRSVIANSPHETFSLGVEVGRELVGGEMILLTGGLGAGKTVIAKGIMSALDYDPDDVTSPSFTLVNLYRAKLEVYHIDLWRLDDCVAVEAAVGLDDIVANENAVVIIEWAEKLRDPEPGTTLIRIAIHGDGDDPRTISI